MLLPGRAHLCSSGCCHFRFLNPSIVGLSCPNHLILSTRNITVIFIHVPHSKHPNHDLKCWATFPASFICLRFVYLRKKNDKHESIVDHDNRTQSPTFTGFVKSLVWNRPLWHRGVSYQTWVSSIYALFSIAVILLLSTRMMNLGTWQTWSRHYRRINVH